VPEAAAGQCCSVNPSLWTDQAHGDATPNASISTRSENLPPKAARHAGTTEISAVLKAMHVPVDWAMGTLRFSVGRNATREEIDRTIQVVARAVRLLRPEA